MFAHTKQLLLDEYKIVHQIGFDEVHVDRKMNVISSGFAHHKYFQDVQKVIIKIFNNTNYTNQPKYIADMGCGDGTFLKQTYETIVSNTMRGKVLDKYPLLLIGADYSSDSLRQTTQTHFISISST